MLQHGDNQIQNGDKELFLSLAEQLTRPFLQLKQLAEITDTKSVSPDELQARWQMVAALSTASLQLTQSYALNIRLRNSVTPLCIEPVVVASVLRDTASELSPLASQYGVQLQLDITPNLQPLLTDRSVLQSALTSLGQVFILAQAESEKPNGIRLSAHRSRYGIVAGLYGQDITLAPDSLRRARALKGRAREPFTKLVSGPATGVFVADSLLEHLSSQLHVARYHALTGLAATLPTSAQLQLV